MAKIYYSVMGEGRGHATRVRAVVESLKHKHDITIFGYNDSYKMLTAAYAGTEVKVRPIPGLMFHYANGRRVDFWKTFWSGIRFLLGLPRALAPIERMLREEQPDLVITDFEPLLPRAAVRVGIPFISLNHQHFLLVNDLKGLPGWLRRRAFILRQVVRLFYWGQRKTIVSSFFQAPLRPEFRDVLQVGVLLRPEVLTAKPEHGDHLVAYLRKFATDGALDALRATGREVRVYGLGERESMGNLKFHEINEQRFVHDLATCNALVTTAGNQLVGEALYLRKPVLALPEANNFEQFINAHYLDQTGAGMWTELEKLGPADLERFLNQVEDLRTHIEPERVNGNVPTLAAIESML